MQILLVEDNARLRPALKAGLEQEADIQIVADCDSGEAALELCRKHNPDLSILDVELAGSWNGITTAIRIREEFPRHPIIFYSIQDDDRYFKDFCDSGILSHYAYIKKSNYLLPSMLLPLFEDALAGRGYIDPDIEQRVQQVRRNATRNPLDLLEPAERRVALMVSTGMTNQQIADRLGYKDRRTIARVNGQIYSTWGLNESAMDEKVARTRLALIVQTNRLIAWDDDGTAQVENEQGDWVEWQPLPER